jgi:hypothetical protein
MESVLAARLQTVKAPAWWAALSLTEMGKATAVA